MSNKVPKLGGGPRFQPADFTVARYVAHVPSDTTMKDVLHPDYFQNHLDRLKPGMEVCILSDDFSLDARLRCLTITKVTATFRILDVYAGEYDPEDKALTGETDEIEVNFGGPQHKWRLVHRGEVIEKGFATKEDAEKARATLLETNG